LHEAAIAEAVTCGALERLELVADPDYAAVRQLGAVALDDPPRLVGVLRVHGDPDLAEPVDRERENRMRKIRGDDRRHAVRLEQAADDARFNVRLRAKDDGEVGHDSQLATTALFSVSSLFSVVESF